MLNLLSRKPTFLISDVQGNALRINEGRVSLEALTGGIVWELDVSEIQHVNFPDEVEVRVFAHHRYYRVRSDQFGIVGTRNLFEQIKQFAK